jgi:hypothetical protein
MFSGNMGGISVALRVDARAVRLGCNGDYQFDTIPVPDTARPESPDARDRAEQSTGADRLQLRLRLRFRRRLTAGVRLPMPHKAQLGDQT